MSAERHLQIKIGTMSFRARLEWKSAPQSCAAITAMLPISGKLVQSRWSGESAWVSLGVRALEVEEENVTSYMAPGDMLLFASRGEKEIMLGYGSARFSSHIGQLAGNRFATVLAAREELAAIGTLLLRDGEQDITFEGVPGEVADDRTRLGSRDSGEDRQGEAGS